MEAGYLFPVGGARNDEAGCRGDAFRKLALAELRLADREGVTGDLAKMLGISPRRLGDDHGFPRETLCH